MNRWLSFGELCLMRNGDHLERLFWSELLLGKIPNGNPSEIKFSLYLLAQLSYGIALIVQKRGDILCRDMETFIPIIRRYQEGEENEASMKGKKDRKKRAMKQNDLLILDSSFETIESEHLKFVLDYSAITLREDIPLPEIDTLFNDDFGPLTAAEALQMEALLKEDSEHIIESKSGSVNGSKEYIMSVVPEALASNAVIDKAAHVFEMMEVSDESDTCKEKHYDLGFDEALREPQIKNPPYLSVLELSEVHDSQILIPKKRRRKHGTIIDEITMFSKMQLQAQIDSTNDLLHTRDEMIPQISKSGIVSVQDLFHARPMTLREFSRTSASNLDAWIAAPEYNEPPLQYEEAMQLEPMQAPPVRILHHSLVERETSNELKSHESMKTKLQDLERQVVTPTMEDIERTRRNTTSTTLFGGTHITDPSSQLKSDEGLSIALDGSRQFNEKIKISVATIFERIDEENALRKCMDDSFILPAEKTRMTDLFSNLAIGSGLCGTKLESSFENVLVDERHSKSEVWQKVPHDEINVQKISVMQDQFQLKVDKIESTVETGDSSVPVYYQTQKAHDLFGLITEFLDFCKISSLCFSELIRGRSAVFAAKAFTNLLELLAKQKIKVKQEENFAEIVIRLS
uniref:Rad21_Rec8 domain-containing protein n=1 Tax=Elaeophora elaphi TaxID=1147741 RepID=A0A0R3RRV2_9BILA